MLPDKSTVFIPKVVIDIDDEDLVDSADKTHIEESSSKAKE